MRTSLPPAPLSVPIPATRLQSPTGMLYRYKLLYA